MKYIKRIWFLTAIPAAIVLVSIEILRDIWTGAIDNEKWQYWK